MREKIKKYTILAYIIVMSMLSLLLLSIQQTLPMLSLYAIILPQLAPGMAALLLVLYLNKGKCVDNIKDQFIQKGLSRLYLVISAFVPFVITVIGAMLLSSMGIEYQTWMKDKSLLLGNIVFMLLGCIGEEIGWRGMLLPLMQKKYSSLTSAILIGIVWGIWHLNFEAGIIGFLIYVFNCVLISIIMTWLFNRTNKNIWSAVIWHFMGNLGFHLFLWERDFTYTFLVLDSLYILFIIIGCVLNRIRKKDAHI